MGQASTFKTPHQSHLQTINTLKKYPCGNALADAQFILSDKYCKSAKKGSFGLFQRNPCLFLFYVNRPLGLHTTGK
jgi:hypothetical protein